MFESPWPGGKKAAVSFTMDNLGEPLEIQLGLWPADGPFGTHSSIKECLPHVLEILEQHSVKATYFAEAWSLGTYSEVVKDMMNRGHEIAWHAYQHEIWDKLSPKEEEVNFQKSIEVAREFGIKYAGFRPPGGTYTETTSQLLRCHGFRYISPLEQNIVTKDGVITLPFKWRDVDAFYYAPEFAFLRKSFGEAEDVMGPQVLEDYLMRRISETVESNGHLTMLFHPFLQTSKERLLVMRNIVERISNDVDIWCAPYNQVAEWIQNHPDSFKDTTRYSENSQ